MSALAVSLIAFTIVFGGALLGIYVHLPEGHLRERKRRCKAQYWSHWDDSRSCPGAADLLGQESYDASNTQIKQITSNIIFLDILLEQYGPEAHDLRVALRDAVPPTVDRIWNERTNGNKSEPFVATAEAVAFIKKVQELKPDNVDRPFAGLLQISREPLQHAVAPLAH